MSKNETGVRDTEYINVFQKLIAWRKAIPDEKLRLQWLEGLLRDYQVLKPLIPGSQPWSAGWTGWSNRREKGMDTETMGSVT